MNELRAVKELRAMLRVRDTWTVGGALLVKPVATGEATKKSNAQPSAH